MNAELESVTKTGKIDQRVPEAQTKIRTEVVLASIDPQLLPENQVRNILGTIK